jgi:hypothetical protein
MTAVQTSYTESPAAGAPGQEYDCAFSDVVSWTADEAIPFGAYVVESREGGCELPDSSGEITGNKGGIALIDGSLPSGVGYQIGDQVRVLRKGRAFVLSDETLAKGDTLFVRHTSGAGGTQKGSFRNDADTATAATPVGVSIFKGGAANAVVLELLGN